MKKTDRKAFRMRPDTTAALAVMADRDGVSEAAWIERLIRQEAREQGVLPNVARGELQAA